MNTCFECFFLYPLVKYKYNPVILLHHTMLLAYLPEHVRYCTCLKIRIEKVEQFFFYSRYFISLILISFSKTLDRPCNIDIDRELPTTFAAFLALCTGVSFAIFRNLKNISNLKKYA